MSWGAGLLASFVKAVPILGALVYAPVVYGTTWGIGRVVDAYFDGLRDGRIPSAAELKDLFARELAKGKAQGASIRKEQLERAYDELRRKVEERERGTVSQIKIREKQVRKPKESAAEPAAPAEPGKKLDLAPSAKATSESPLSPPPATAAELPAKTIGPSTPAAGVSLPSSEAAQGRLVDELERLAKLRELGVLTAEELEIAKKKLLN
jgi:hypothetical protein